MQRVGACAVIRGLLPLSGSHMLQVRPQRLMIATLAVTQVAAWGSIYYAFSILSADIQRDLGLRPEIVFGGFSWSLLVAGLLAAPFGALLDRHGGRMMMGGGSLCAALGLALLGMSSSAAGYLFAWTVIGMSMGLVLYEAAFATINREFAQEARRTISILTLFGGFASTVFWPLTLKLNGLLGWRDTYLMYAGVQLLVCAPLHLLLPARARCVSTKPPAKSSYTLTEAIRHPAFWWLAAAFAANSFVFSALSVHLIPLLQRMGHAAGTVVVFAALIGPMQVAGRIGEMAFARHASPRVVGAVTFAVLPLALLTFVAVGVHEWAAIAFCLLYGLSNGIITIVRGTLPQALYGAENYGAISGAIAGPSLILKAAGPLAVAWIVSVAPHPRLVVGILLAVSLISLVCFVVAIRARQLRQRDSDLEGMSSEVRLR